MKKKFVLGSLMFICTAFISCHQCGDDLAQRLKLAKIDIWGSDSAGYCVETYNPNGERYLKFSDSASDTSSMRNSAYNWLVVTTNTHNAKKEK